MLIKSEWLEMDNKDMIHELENQFKLGDNPINPKFLKKNDSNNYAVIYTVVEKQLDNDGDERYNYFDSLIDAKKEALFLYGYLTERERKNNTVEVHLKDIIVETYFDASDDRYSYDIYAQDSWEYFTIQELQKWEKEINRD